MKPAAFLVLSLMPGVVLATGQFSEIKNDIGSLPMQLIGPVAPMSAELGWRYSAGLGLEYEAEYHGSDEAAAEVDVFAEIAYRADNWEFQSNLLANRIIYQASDHFFITGWLNLEEGREADHASDGSLDGMGTVDEMLEFGGGVMWQPMDRLTLGLVAQSYAGGDPDKGIVGFATVHYRLYDRKNFKLDISADMSFANADHLQTEFGVTPEQALSSGYQVYEFDSGIKSYGVGFNGVYALDDHWSVSFEGHYEAYATDVTDSPIIEVGTENEIEAGVTLIYKF
ncbi:MipA/OmpV family protein [Catenovulum sp. SM1970]|uniref:MipA/OmpV family protein n=1 Tax=Marinifaba aquimaris TaxID=2741323 RepID=UPI001572C80A|nr:MipA/OmpV family protein [Marinifaba aquimaris]NTS75811.1 MipA/OmpV family protein [Marinifaba aquimaris]